MRRARTDIMAETSVARTRRRLGPWSVTAEHIRRAEDEVFLGLSIRAPAPESPLPSGAATDLFATDIRAPEEAVEPPASSLDDVAADDAASPPPAPWRFLEEER